MGADLKRFEVGDLVRWNTQVRGVQRSRIGVVAAVVPAGATPLNYMPPGRWRVMFLGSASRARASYLVALKGAGRGMGILYHPHLCHLQPWQEFGRQSKPTRAAVELKLTTQLLVDRGVVAPRVADDRALVPYRPSRWGMPSTMAIVVMVGMAAWLIVLAVLFL